MKLAKDNVIRGLFRLFRSNKLRQILYFHAWVVSLFMDHNRGSLFGDCEEVHNPLDASKRTNELKY